MTVKKASEKTKLSVQSIRVWIQQGDCPFGTIIRKGSRNTYYINKKALKKWQKGRI